MKLKTGYNYNYVTTSRGISMRQRILTHEIFSVRVLACTYFETETETETGLFAS